MSNPADHIKAVTAKLIERSTTEKQREKVAAAHDRVRAAGYRPMTPAPASEVTLTDEQLARLSKRREAQLVENRRRREAGETAPVAPGVGASIYRNGVQGYAGDVKPADVWPVVTGNTDVAKTIDDVAASAAREFGGSVADDLAQEMMLAAVTEWLPKYISERSLGARDTKGRLVAAATGVTPGAFEQAGAIQPVHHVPVEFSADWWMNRDERLAEAASAAVDEKPAGAFVGTFARREVGDMRNEAVHAVSAGQKAARDLDYTHELDEAHDRADRTERRVDATVAQYDLLNAAIVKVAAEFAAHSGWTVGEWTCTLEDIAAHQPGERGGLLALWGNLDKATYDKRLYVVKKAKKVLAATLTAAGITPELLAA